MAAAMVRKERLVMVVDIDSYPYRFKVYSGKASANTSTSVVARVPAPGPAASRLAGRSSVPAGKLIALPDAACRSHSLLRSRPQSRSKMLD
jgi:hypothetical protein